MIANLLLCMDRMIVSQSEQDTSYPTTEHYDYSLNNLYQWEHLNVSSNDHVDSPTPNLGHSWNTAVNVVELVAVVETILQASLECHFVNSSLILGKDNVAVFVAQFAKAGYGTRLQIIEKLRTISLQHETVPTTGDVQG